MTGTVAAALNRTCFCVPVEPADVHEELARAGLGEAARRLSESHPGLFASQGVFVGREDVARMQAVVDAIEAVVALPAYQTAALADAPPIAAELPAHPAVLHGFDFHLGESGPRLIEINTNAGGIMLALAANRALHRGCGALWERPPAANSDRTPPDPGIDAALPEALWWMFVDVWQQARGGWPLNRIAIVDERPQEQYLYPEFELFAVLLRRHGVAVDIADPAELEFDGERLRRHGQAVDLVYNRCTDFYLEGAALAALQQAALARAVVLTPDPRAHALYANKRNLARMTDPERLAEWGVDRSVREVLLRAIPRTEIVRPEHAERLWAERKRLFFKPARGFGSRGSYRGDKLTRGRFEALLADDYVAQALVPPGARLPGAGAGDFRFDVRSWVYRGRTLLQAARVYRGQTTNFRTAGGGFAPLLQTPAADEGLAC
ncbi:MAG TPA: hypothetical protein VF210_04830 [Pseudomonadales bacterium]